MKKAIVLTTFGSSNIKAIEESIGLLIKDLKKSIHINTNVYLAFTSNIIRKKINEKYNYKILSLEESLNYLLDEDYEEVFIKPLHIFSGNEIKKIEILVDEYKNKFKRLKLGTCLLKEEGEEVYKRYYEVSEIIFNEMIQNESSNILFIGHGSKTSTYKEYEVLISYIKLRCSSNIYFGTLEGSESLEKIISNLKADNIKHLKIIPILMIKGKHYISDIIEDKESWINLLKKQGFEIDICDKSLLQLSGIRNIIVKDIINNL